MGLMNNSYLMLDFDGDEQTDCMDMASLPTARYSCMEISQRRENNSMVEFKEVEESSKKVMVCILYIFGNSRPCD